MISILIHFYLLYLFITFAAQGNCKNDIYFKETINRTHWEGGKY
jgi:hypothetical protein